MSWAQPGVDAPSPYRLPWEGDKKFRVSQTRGTSHRGAMLHALDFALPHGEAVLAARGGTVVFREDRYSLCGGPSLATRGNHVVLDHGDGTSALYLHLDRIQVALGQKVAQGDPLGTCGATGWTGCTAHLHFQVQHTSREWFARSLPIVFGDPDVRAQEPTGAVKYDRSYVSGNRAPTEPGASVLVAGSSSGSRPTGGGPVVGQRATTRVATSVRERPTTESRRLGAVYPGQAFEVVEIVSGQAVEPPEDRWVRLRLGSLTGFVYSRPVQDLASEKEPARSPSSPTTSPTTSPTPSSTAPAPSSAPNSAPGSATTRLAAALRQQPTAGSPRLSLVPPGSRVEILEYVQGQILEDGRGRWARVRTGALEGFMYASLLGNE